MENDLYTKLVNGLGSEYDIKLNDGYISIKNGKDFYISIPANHQGPIDVVMMYPGDDDKRSGGHELSGSAMRANVESVRETNSDAIIVQSGAYNNKWDLVDITDKIMECTDLDYDRFVSRGHSAGCMGATRSAAIYARRHPENTPPSVALIASNYKYANIEIKEKDIDTLNSCGAQIIALTTSKDNTIKTHGLDCYLGKGAKLLFVKRTDGSHISHASINNEAYDMDIIGYILGNDNKFNNYKIKYRINVYDPETGELIEKGLKPEEAQKYLDQNKEHVFEADVQSVEYISTANFDDFKERFKNLLALNNLDLSKLKGLDNISSDKQFVLNSMKGLINAVNGTRMLSGIGGCGTSSTTRVPVCAKDYVYSYSRMLVTLLEKISNEALDAIGVALDIDMTDKKLKTDVDNFDDLIINKNVTPVIPEEKTTAKATTNNPQGSVKTQDHPNNNNIPHQDNSDNKVNQVTYDIGTGCKMMLDLDENKNIINMEYRYDFGSAENASKMLPELTNKYSQIKGFKSITQSDKYIKINFNDEFTKTFTFESIDMKYRREQ